jgi:hypothetical protein
MKAEYEACWAGKFVYMCETHLRQLINIGSAMGAPVEYHVYEGKEICKNCENEKKKEK